MDEDRVMLIAEDTDLGEMFWRYEPGNAAHENYVVAEQEWLNVFPPPWPVWDQGDTLACAAFVAAGAAMCLELRDRYADSPGAPWAVSYGDDRTPSPEFLYFAAKAWERTLGSLCGVYPSTVLRVLELLGACSQATWRELRSRLGPDLNDVERWHPAMWPHIRDSALQDPNRLDGFVWRSLAGDHDPRDIDVLRGCLCENRPFTICLWQFDDYAAPRVAGEFTLPEPGADYMLRAGERQAHAMLVVGYDIGHVNACTPQVGAFVARDSRGPACGADGYYWLPFEWARDPANSFGILTLDRA